MTKHLDALMTAIQRDGRATLDAHQIKGIEREAAEIGYSPRELTAWFRATFPDSMFDVLRYDDPFKVEITRRESR